MVLCIASVAQESAPLVKAAEQSGLPITFSNFQLNSADGRRVSTLSFDLTNNGNSAVHDIKSVLLIHGRDLGVNVGAEGFHEKLSLAPGATTRITEALAHYMEDGMVGELAVEQLMFTDDQRKYDPYVVFGFAPHPPKATLGRDKIR